MPIVPGSDTHDVNDKSKPGCKTRRAVCTGRAKARHAKKGTAVKEAKTEAIKQKDLAVADAKRTITCPGGGCSGGATCRQVGKWFTRGQSGMKTTVKKVGVEWEASSTFYTEKRLKCRCVRRVTAMADDGPKKDFGDISEKTLFGYV